VNSATNPYLLVGARLGVPGTEPILRRLAEWHDAMVAHERARRYESCDDGCPHAQARQLWTEAVKKFGRGANELAFLRSRALQFGKAA
jgi:hypothetical protein